MTVLIIDDDPSIRRLAAAFLSGKAGMTVFEADSGQAGVAMAERERPDAILLDAVMPDMDGPVTFAQLQQHPACASIPVIFLTATTQGDALDQLMSLGARGLLHKPFKPAALPDAVRALLA
jgi:two-component system alkaline phosphatase synthesis response regulator PhoP